MKFYVGLHHPYDAKQFSRSFISINAIKERKSEFVAQDWIMDSGAFTTIMKNGGYTEKEFVYAQHIKRWSRNGNLVAAVAQDYMCEPHMLKKTGMCIQEHQRLTIKRYDELINCDTGDVYVMPVLQGYSPKDYVQHIAMYGYRLSYDAYVGVGSVCKRNGRPQAIVDVLQAIKRERCDLRLHGFGVKTIALRDKRIQNMLFSSDSMAWSFAARKQGRNANDWREGKLFENRVLEIIGERDLMLKNHPVDDLFE